MPFPQSLTRPEPMAACVSSAPFRGLSACLGLFLLIASPSARAQGLEGAIQAEAGKRGGELAGWYKARGYKPVWTSERLAGLAQFIRSLEGHGLHPELFSFSTWDAHWRNPKPDVQTRATVEVGTTHMALFAIQSVAYGFTSPSEFHPKWRELSRSVSSYQFLDNALQVAPHQLGDFLLNRVPPPDNRYRKMVETLARYRKIAGHGGWRNLPNTQYSLGVGSPFPEIQLLRSRLQAEGDLGGIGGKFKGKTLDRQTSEALKSFQFRHGITPDGQIGPKTIEELNTPVEERIKSIIINIDRLRWMPRAYEQADHIEVNIAESALRVYDRGKRLTTMPVIVGVKGKHQTPVFHGQVQYMFFRPYWNVPPSIAKTELVPKAMADPTGYFAKYNYEIVPAFGVSPSKVLPPTHANLQKVAAGSLLMRQAAGPTNSLGNVKFIFPNDSSVYLHDTPDRHLFKATDRDFSHGCVRVARPDELADILLKRNGGWNLHSVRAAMEDVNNPNRKENLSKPMPVYLVYWTSTIMGDDRVRFDQDIYGHDHKMFQRFGLR